MALQSNYIATTTAQTLIPSPGKLSDLSAFFGVSGMNIIAYDSDAAGGEIFNLMDTRVGDEPFEPTLGSDLPLRVFETINAMLEAKCQQDVYIAGRDWLGHVQVIANQTNIYASVDNRLIGIEIAYSYGNASWTLSVPLVSQALTQAVS